MSFSGPSKIFQSMRYGLIARAMARLNQRYRFSGSPEFRPVIARADQEAVVLSLSPHPDDDIIAVGGALAGHIVAGGSVHSVVLTDGVRGTADASGDAELAAIRRKECESAASILKLSSITFWDLPDGQLEPGHENIERIGDLIRRYRPDYVYVPFPIDYHFDHIAATAMVVTAISTLSEPPLLRCYESIIPLIPNTIIDITDFVDLKRRAVACFETQNDVTDYLRTIVEGLNRHRSYGQMKGRGYGEAVFETEWRLVAEIQQIVHGRTGYVKQAFNCK